MLWTGKEMMQIRWLALSLLLCSQLQVASARLQNEHSSVFQLVVDLQIISRLKYVKENGSNSG